MQDKHRPFRLTLSSPTKPEHRGSALLEEDVEWGDDVDLDVRQGGVQLQPLGREGARSREGAGAKGRAPEAARGPRRLERAKGPGDEAELGGRSPWDRRRREALDSKSLRDTGSMPGYDSQRVTQCLSHSVLHPLFLDLWISRAS